MKSTEVRNRFIEYFKRHGHTAVASSSLIPENDPTLLFANAGMNQFKNAFLGLEKRDYNRAVSSQKCVRAGGKHNDLDNVGFTARHHTFFEMLGNFSFGDYFKKEAIHFAWEFLTKELGIPKEKLYVTVFRNDDEAADIWHNQEGVPRDRIFRFDEKDNFWKMGDTGPCGPCTEIFYDHGPKAGKESDPYKGIASGEDRFVEIWNLVFMQFFENPPGTLTPLPKPSVDTGSGLERVVAAMQGKYNNYDTDLFSAMIEKACQIGKLDYVTDIDLLAKNKKIAETTSALRVLADHSRSTAFLIADGALPANEGRGYVLRRIMRRALRYGRKLSVEQSFLPAMIEALVQSMGDIYPELKTRKDHILTTVRDEESRFLTTLDQGTHILQDELKKSSSKTLSGDIAFKLYDTFGFPLDLTELMAAEQGYQVDTAGFEKNMENSRQKAKASWKGKAMGSDEAHLISLVQKSKATEFVGYDHLSTKAQTLLLSNGQKEVDTLNVGETGYVILDKTSFYAEGGGQVGDQGSLKWPQGEAKIHDCIKKNEIFMHQVEIKKGSLKKNTNVDVEVSLSLRRSTMGNHSATHLLHAALRKTLGEHITQAGSLVDSEKLRFDYTHNKPLNSEELQKIEKMVNDEIAASREVACTNMSHKDAIKSGALALFGEKYGDVVRVIKMGDFSTELCGGTHVTNTAQIRLFKIVSEAGVSSGVRRMEAVTGQVAFEYLNKNTLENQQARVGLGINEAWQTYLHETQKTVPKEIEQLKEQIKNLEKELKKTQSSKINVDDLAQAAMSFGSSKFVWADLNIEDRDVLSDINDKIKNKISSGVVITLGQGQGSHPLIISVTKDLHPKLSAGQILKEVAAVLGGKGGGRPDFAQGAVSDRSKNQEALTKAKNILGIIN